MTIEQILQAIKDHEAAASLKLEEAAAKQNEANAVLSSITILRHRIEDKIEAEKRNVEQ